MKKGTLCKVNRMLAYDGEQIERGDLVVVVSPHNYDGAVACQVYNQRMKKKHWIIKKHVDVLT